MPLKRLAISLIAVVVLLGIAGVLELFLVLFPASPEANEGIEMQRETSAQVEQSDEPAAESTVGSDGPGGDSVGAQVDAQVDPDGGRSSAQADSSDVQAGGQAGEQATSSQRRSAVLNEALMRAAELVKSDELTVDGKPLQRDQAEAIVQNAEPFVDNVAHVDQRNILPSGCEVVALSVALSAEGFEISPTDLAEDYLRQGNDFAVDYVGSPKESGGGFPPCIVDAANSYLDAQEASARAMNLTDSTFQGVVDLVELGYPVLVWTTEGMAEPVKVGEERNGLTWYNPEHCVVVYGIEGDDVLVADSLAGLVFRDREDFEHIYDKCGSMAVIVVPGAK